MDEQERGMHMAKAIRRVEVELVEQFMLGAGEATADNIFTNAVMNGYDLYLYEASIPELPFTPLDVADAMVNMYTAGWDDTARPPTLESWAKGMNNIPIIVS